MERTVKKGGKELRYTLIYTSRKSGIMAKALPGGKTNVYAPGFVSLKEADRAVLKMFDDIIKMHASLEEARTPGMLSRGRVLVEGKSLPLKILIGKSNVYISALGVTAVTPNGDIDEARELIKRELVKLALKRITKALDKWSQTVPKPYGRVTIREQRSRWGSCSSLNNLNFNWKLIMAPPEALEYVVVHELCHLLVFNHSPGFWREVENRLPDYEVWKKWLKQNGAALTLD